MFHWFHSNFTLPYHQKFATLPGTWVGNIIFPVNAPMFRVESKKDQQESRSWTKTAGRKISIVGSKIQFMNVHEHHEQTLANRLGWLKLKTLVNSLVRFTKYQLASRVVSIFSVEHPRILIGKYWQVSSIRLNKGWINCKCRFHSTKSCKTVSAQSRFFRQRWSALGSRLSVLW